MYCLCRLWFSIKLLLDLCFLLFLFSLCKSILGFDLIFLYFVVSLGCVFCLGNCFFFWRKGREGGEREEGLF